MRRRWRRKKFKPIWGSPGLPTPWCFPTGRLIARIVPRLRGRETRSTEGKRPKTGEVASGHREKWNAPRLFSPSKGTVSSFSLFLSSAADYQLHLFTQLLDPVYHKGHNGFTHSRCTSLQSNVGGTLYNNNNNNNDDDNDDDNKKRRLGLFFNFFHLPNAQWGDEGSRGNISESLSLKKPEHAVIRLYFLFSWRRQRFFDVQLADRNNRWRINGLRVYIR